MKSMDNFVKLVVLLFLGHCCHLASSVTMEITKQYYDDVVPSAINIRCSLRRRENRTCAKTILSMQVLKDEVKVIARLVRDDSISYGRQGLLRASVTAEGHIDRDVRESYLSVTIKDAVRQDSGLYACHVHYMEDTPQVKQVTASRNLTVDDQDTQDIVRHLVAKVSFLENLVRFKEEEYQSNHALLQSQLQDQQDKIGEIVADNALLQSQLQDQQDKIGEIVADKNTTVMFTALHNRTGPFVKDKVLAFGQVVMNVGGGYDGDSGVFTSPVSGYYLLHVSVAPVPDKYIHLDLRTSDGQVLTRLFGGEPSWQDFSDASCVVKLASGDRVMPFVRHIRNGFALYGWSDTDYYNKFYGYLLKTL